jgi:hypothetical protein
VSSSFNVYSKSCSNYKYFLFDDVYNTSTGLTIRAPCKQVCYFYISNWNKKFSNQHTSTPEIMKKVTSMSGFRSWGFCNYNSQRQCTTNPEIVKRDPHFWDFRVWNFANSTTKINTGQLPKSQKVTSTSGFREYRGQTSTGTNL